MKIKIFLIISFLLFSFLGAQESSSNLLPSECKTIPPMILFLPPPLEKELIECKNIVFKPTLKSVQKKFKTAKKVQPLSGFEKVYKITLENNLTLFCNQKLSRCFQGKEINISQTSSKDPVQSKGGGGGISSPGAK